MNDKLEVPDFLKNLDPKYSNEIPLFLSAIQFRKTQSGIEISEEKMKLAWANWLKDHQKIIDFGV